MEKSSTRLNCESKYNTYMPLFNYLHYDLNHIKYLRDKFITEKHDINKMHDNMYFEEMINIISKSHPFYENYENAEKKVKEIINDKHNVPNIIQEQKILNEKMMNYIDIRSMISIGKITEYSNNLVYLVYASYTELNQILLYQLIDIMSSGVNVKQCNCCNRYFITDDNRIKYCDRIYRGDKKCIDIGPNIHFVKNQDSLYKAYRAAVSRNKMRNLRKRITDDQFKCWNDKAKELVEKESKKAEKWLNMNIKDINKLCNL